MTTFVAFIFVFIIPILAIYFGIKWFKTAYVGAIRTQRRRTSVQLVGRNSYSVSV